MLEAERIGERIQFIRARPWPERPVSEANKSGNDTAATRRAMTYSRSLPVGRTPIRFQPYGWKSRMKFVRGAQS